MKKYFVWKELSDDGLLKEPKARRGPYTDDCLNPHPDGFETEEQAIRAFESFKKEHEYNTPNKLVLLTIYVYED